jgi:hypothetical protein
MEWRSVAEAALAALGAAVTAYVLSLRARAHPVLKPGAPESVQRLLLHGRRKLLTNLFDVGGFLGIDIGGSLTKLVFFSPDSDLVDRMLRRAPEQHVEASGWRSKLSAVRQVEAFMLSTVSYGGTGTRDAHLSFHIAELGGTFHFVR